MGNGNGTFQRPAIFDVAAFPVAIAIADMNADGIVDLAVSFEWSIVQILLGDGRGAFQTQHLYGTGFVPRSIALADLDADGDTDIGVTNYHFVDRSAWVLFNNSIQGCAADMNGDGVLNVLDFVEFQLLWQAGDRQADCDGTGEFNVLDFVCYQQAFVAGCR
jgi:hypothetical protein